MTVSAARLPARLLAGFEAGLSHGFGDRHNPFHFLGALSVGFLWIALVTGVYLFIFYRTSLDGAYASVEALTRDQWFAGGIMRSVHRYASDAAVVCLVLHMLRELIRGRFRGPRWFSWLTGTPLIWIVLLFGITGYWMVWDQMGQYVAQASAELLDALPIFTAPMSRNFMADDALGSRLFTLIAFIHLVGLPLVIVIAIWFHLMRVRFPRLNPPRHLFVSSLIVLLVLAIIVPVTSHSPADLSQVPGPLRLDWFYLAIFPLLDVTSGATIWTLAAGGTLLLAAMPLLPGGDRRQKAEVFLPDCSGCGYCAEDCPYGAIDMVARSDGRNFETEARVNPALCVACGICAGSCPSSSPFRQRSPLTTGIELPEWRVELLRDALSNPAPDPGGATLVVIGCEHAADAGLLTDLDVKVVSLPCVGMLPAAMIDFALRKLGYRGVLLSGCADCDCHHRLGERWLRERIDWQRPPALRERVDRRRLEVCNLKVGQHARLAEAVERLRRRVESLDAQAQDSPSRMIGA